MIKTLRIISIVAPIFALILFVFLVLFGVRGDGRIEDFSDSPGVVEKFMSAAGDEATRGESQISPLVRQAQDFAKHLNPPESKIGKSTGLSVKGINSSLFPVTPKFKLIGTSYFEKQPELSIALIDEPGAGLHWVRQSSKVGHLLIEQIKDGLIVVKSSNETYEMEAEREPEMSLIEGASTVSKNKASPTKSSKSNVPAVNKTVGNIIKKVPRRFTPQIKTFRTIPRRSPEEQARLKELGDKLIDTNSISRDEEKLARIEKLISDYQSESLRVSAEEAQKLEDLGEELKDVQEDPNEFLPVTDSDK